jgi:hypothetical protein
MGLDIFLSDKPNYFGTQNLSHIRVCSLVDFQHSLPNKSKMEFLQYLDIVSLVHKVMAHMDLLQVVV